MNETLFRENQVSRTASGVQYRAGLFGVPRSRGLQSALPGLPAKGGTPNSADRIVCATTGLFLVNVTLFRENQVSRTPLGVQYRAGLFGVPRSRGLQSALQDYRLKAELQTSQTGLSAPRRDFFS